MIRMMLLVLVACAPVGESTAASAISVDNRTEFQLALNAGTLDLRGKPGRYYIDIPPYPRPIATLTMPDGASIIGDGVDITTIVFRGDPMGHDWAGIRVGDNWRITGVSFVVEEPAGNWDEQSHVLEIVGPVSGGELSYSSFDHPVVPGSSRGDCIRFRGYDPLPDGTADKRIWNQTVHHVEFRHAARSGVAVYGGLNASRFHHLTFGDTSDQDLDMETATRSFNSFEWDHNIHRLGPSSQSSLAVSLYPGEVHLHHNTLDGRGLDILGGSHDIHDNVITLAVPSPDPVVYERKTGSTQFRRETWTRTAAAGPGVVFSAAQKITAPSNVTLDDVTFIQYTPQIALAVSGVAGVTMRGLTVIDLGPPGVRDAIRIEGTALTRTTPVLIADCAFTGTFRAAVSVSGSYLGGVGSIEIRDCSAPGAATMLRQENVDATTARGGIAGPVITEDNRP